MTGSGIGDSMGVSILKLKAVTAKTGLSKSVIYEKIADGTFPKQVHLTSRSIGFVESEINQWLEDRIAERDSEVA